MEYVSNVRHSLSMRQRVGDDVRVNFFGVSDFVTAAATAAFYAGNVVQAFRRIHEHDLAAKFEAFKQRGSAILQIDPFHFVDHLKQWVVHLNLRQFFVGK